LVWRWCHRGLPWNRTFGLQKYDFGIVPNGITFILIFILICPVVLQLNHANRQTRPAHNAFLSCTSCKERIVTGALHAFLPTGVTGWGIPTLRLSW
jgi:hypothetical protein